jgi:signal transduction histidine kinase
MVHDQLPTRCPTRWRGGWTSRGGRWIAWRRVVSTLIDVSRITSGRVQVARQLADLVEVIRVVAERFGEEALRSGSSLRFERPGPIWGNFDVSRVDQVLTNLVANAIRYGRGRPIVVGAASVGQTARFWVQDQGIGIAPEHQARIFQRYERAAPSTNYAGLGLGLWISRQLVEAMGGTISVSQRSGHGFDLHRRDPPQRLILLPRPAKRGEGRGEGAAYNAAPCHERAVR